MSLAAITYLVVGLTFALYIELLAKVHANF